ncbi:MAG: hypothetical protein IJA61_04355 [Clostridia bacterium]|nr:hypothetical protein [Clostridia bacterium]
MANLFNKLKERVNKKKALEESYKSAVQDEKIEESGVIDSFKEAKAIIEGSNDGAPITPRQALAARIDLEGAVPGYTFSTKAYNPRVAVSPLESCVRDEKKIYTGIEYNIFGKNYTEKDLKRDASVLETAPVDDLILILATAEPSTLVKIRDVIQTNINQKKVSLKEFHDMTEIRTKETAEEYKREQVTLNTLANYNQLLSDHANEFIQQEVLDI